jgi:hypothetical protein
MSTYQTTEKREPKIGTNVRLEAADYSAVLQLARLERRVFADMVRVLIAEALEARKAVQK